MSGQLKGSRVLTFQNSFYSTPGSVGPLDKSISLQVPIDLYGSQVYISLISCTFSSTIPNVFNYTAPQGGVPFAFNNSVIGVSRDGGATWLAINLPNGVYTIPIINAAINDATITAGWWTPAVPQTTGFTLSYNLSTSIPYISIDSTLLAAPGVQFGVDFAYQGSTMWTTLGFSTAAASKIIINGLSSSQNQGQLDTYGSSVHIHLQGFGALGVLNSSQSDLFTVASLINTGGVVPPAYLFPQGQAMPKIKLWNACSPLNKYSVLFDGSNEMPLVWLSGSSVEICILLEMY